jgi:hypothetical protein
MSACSTAPWRRTSAASTKTRTRMPSEGRADRRCPRHHPAPAGGLCDPNRAGRHVAVGRPEAAGWAGAGGVR